MIVGEIRDICGDYAIDIKSGVLNKEALTLYFNSRKNAEMVKYIIETDSSVPNVATVADVEKVKHAYWGLVRSGRKVVCSRCETPAPFDKKRGYHTLWCSDYCPNCGAKMDSQL